MNRPLFAALCAVVLAFAQQGFPADPAPKGGAPATVVLDTAGVWRVHETLAPPVVQSDEGAKPLLFGKLWLEQGTPPPRARSAFRLASTSASDSCTSSNRPTEVSVSIAAKLFQMPRRDVVGTTEISRSVTAETESMDGIVAAFDDALGKVLKRVVEWTLVTGQSAPRSR